MTGRTCGTISSYVHGAARRDPSTPLRMCPLCGEWFVQVGNHETKMHRR